MEQFIALLVSLHNQAKKQDLPVYAQNRNIKNLVHYMYIQGVIPMAVHKKCIAYLKPFDEVIEVNDPWAYREYEANRKLAYELLIVVH